MVNSRGDKCIEVFTYGPNICEAIPCNWFNVYPLKTSENQRLVMSSMKWEWVKSCHQDILLGLFIFITLYFVYLLVFQ